VPEDFLIAVNPDGDSALPYLLRVPLGDGIILKSRDTWPRTAKVYCHRIEAWPAEPEIVARIPTRRCEQRGAAIDLVLDRKRENRSQFVITRIRGGRQAIFWQTSRTTKQARPMVSVPRARASGLPDLTVVVDTHERYAYSFGDRPVTVERRALPAGDYGVTRDGDLLGVVERKSLADLVGTMVSGRLDYQMADLAAVPRAALVVEDRYSAIYKLDRVRPAVIADGLAECQVRWPGVPVIFCETRKLAQEWTYRFLAAVWMAADEESLGAAAVARLASADPLPPRPATPGEVRAWARENGHAVSDKGRVPRRLVEAYDAARNQP